MNINFFDVIVAKEYETKTNGTVEKKTAWNQVGRAWTSKTSDSLCFELFLIPNQRYVIQLKEKLKPQSMPDFEDFSL